MNTRQLRYGVVSGSVRLGLVGQVVRRAQLLGGLVLGGLTGTAYAATCNVPDMAHATIQSAVNDLTCSEVVLAAKVFTEQVRIRRTSIVTIRGAGEGRTILKSPATRTRSTATTTFASGYTYVVDVMPGSQANLVGLTVDGGSNANCTERYFGVRYTSSQGQLTGVTIDNVRGTGANASCINVTALAVTADGTGTASVAIERATVRNFQANAILINGVNAAATIKNSTIRGSGPISGLFQNGIYFARGATGAADRNNLSDLRYTGDPCRGVGTAMQAFKAGPTFFTGNIIRNVDRGMWLHENTSDQVAYENRIVDSSAGILSNSNGDGKIRITKNGISNIARSTAATVDTCFAESGDDIAVRTEKSSALVANSIAGSARDGIELATDTSALDVQQNKATRSTRNDVSDQGTMNKLTLNSCNKSTPTGKCDSTP